MTSITRERELRASVGLVLRTREQARLRFDYTNSRPVDEPAIQAFNHISVTNPGNYSSPDAHWRGIEAIGIARFSATGISYNGGVLPGGLLYEGQPWGRRGAHTVNTRKRSICSQSGCPSIGSSLVAPSWNNNVTGRALVFARNVDDPVTDADIDAAGRYWAAHKLCGLLAKNARQHGHRCCATKDCPGNRVWVRLDDIADATATYVRTGLPGVEEDDMFTTRDAEKLSKVHQLLAREGSNGIEAFVDLLNAVDKISRDVNALSAKVDALTPPAAPPA